MSTRFQVTFDCADPDALCGFWREALHYEEQAPPEGHASWEEFLASIGVPEDQRNNASACIDPEGVGPRLYFQRVPEGKSAKNRVHLDLNIAGGPDADQRKRMVDSEVERLLSLGASRVRADTEMGVYWVVMLDPEGNEFCVH